MKLKVTCTTTDPSGKTKTFSTHCYVGRLNGLDPFARERALGVVYDFLSHKLPPLFHGCEVTIDDGANIITGHVDPDTKQFVIDKGKT